MSSLVEESDHDLWNYTALYNSLSSWQKQQLTKLNSESGVECLLRSWFKLTNNKFTQGSVCEGIWDNVYCWPDTPSGTEITRTCTEIFEETHPTEAAHLKGSVKRVCQNSGEWAVENESIYEECVQSFEASILKLSESDFLYPTVYYILFIGSILSLVCLGVSLSIFHHFRCLHCDRVTVQSHLMLSLVVRFILMLAISEPLVFGQTSNYRNVEFLCESVLVAFLYATFATISWMFVQGLYLNVTLMFPIINFDVLKQLKLYYIIGWVVPAVFVGGYVIAMLLKEQEKCWDGYSDMNEIWILQGPAILELMVNGMFMVNILRIVVNKVRNSNSRPDSSQIRAAAKATAFLIPVLGINNLVLLHNPGGKYNQIFVILKTFFGSTQGMFVSIVYCFTNKEVLEAVRRKTARAKARRDASLNSNLTKQNLQHVELTVM